MNRSCLSITKPPAAESIRSITIHLPSTSQRFHALIMILNVSASRCLVPLCLFV
ncbi:hypothetical protein RSAG8_06144, partial [Rhizoctonia solani AG-8 WAC10335]